MQSTITDNTVPVPSHGIPQCVIEVVRVAGQKIHQFDCPPRTIRTTQHTTAARDRSTQRLVQPIIVRTVLSARPSRNDQGNPAAGRNARLQDRPDPPLGLTALLCHWSYQFEAEAASALSGQLRSAIVASRYGKPKARLIASV